MVKSRPIFYHCANEASNNLLEYIAEILILECKEHHPLILTTIRLMPETDCFGKYMFRNKHLHV